MDITIFFKDNTLHFPLFLLATITFLLFIIKQTKLLSSKSIKKPSTRPTAASNHRKLASSRRQTTRLHRNPSQTIRPPHIASVRPELLVVASSPEAAMGVLKTQDRFLSSRAVPAAFQQKDLLPHSIIWSECNQSWKNLRTICRSELFSAKSLESQSRLRAEKVSQMVDFLRRKQRQAIDVEDVVFTTLLNTLSSIIFGKDMVQYADEDGTCDWLKESMHKIIEYGGRVKDLGSFYPMLERFDLHGTTRGAKKVFDKVYAYLEPIIDERRAVVGSSTWSSDQAQSFLDRLLENGFTSNQVYQFVMELFVAGSNTTTSTVVWAMTELLRHKEVMSKVEEEMQNEIESDRISVSQLSQLTYLQSCIKETYRLHPPVPLLLPRMANETCEVMNYTIPKNTKVFVNLWAMGRDPKVWHEPLRYMPERFINSKVDFKGQDFELLPFGSGRRICAGMPSGIKSVEYILATLIREFAWTLPNGDDPSKLDVQEKFGIAMKRENPLKVIFKQK